MIPMTRDVAREAALRRRLHDALWTFSPFCVDEADSTHTVMAALAGEGAPEGTFVLAERQTAGRGRFERTWASPAGGLYLTLLVRPRADDLSAEALAKAEPPTARALYGLTASLGVLDAVEGMVGPGLATLKWPNDLLADGRKLAGLLSVAGTDGRGAPYVALGIGVNAAQEPALLPLQAARLADLGASDVDLDALAVAIVAAVAGHLERLRVGGSGPILNAWLARSGWAGRRVRVAADAACPGDVTEGVVLGLGLMGELRVRRDDGAEVALAAGDATIVKEG